MSFSELSRIKVSPFLMIICAALGGQACRPNYQEQDTSELRGNISEGSDYLWPNATASVCWERDIKQDLWNKFAPVREKMASYVTSQMARAGFTLTGWQPCESHSRGIRIAQKQSGVDPDTDRVLAFGRRLDGLHGGVLLSMNHGDIWGQTTALHELGHAIGLRHEANRFDSVCALDQYLGLGDHGDGALPLGFYDRDSIMNYCKDLTSDSIGFVVPLSAGDIATIKALYGGPMALPREESCRKDGNSWVSNTMNSCCRIATGKQAPINPQYPLCPSENPQPAGVVSPSPQSEPQQSLTTQRFSSKAYFRTLLNLPFGDNTGLTLICDQGEFFRNHDLRKSVSTQEIVFILEQAAGLGRDSFSCTHIDSYQLDDKANRVNTNNKIGRLTFSTPLQVKIGSESGVVDLTKIPWQIFDNPQQAPALNPNPIQNPEVGPTKMLTVHLEKFPPKLMVESPYLVCGAEKIPGQGSVNGSESGVIDILFAVPQHLTCYGLDMMIGLPNEATKDQQRQFLALKFNKNIQIKDHNDQIQVTVPAPSCLAKPEAQISPSAASAPASPACDMSKAAENDGWGYDHTKKESCR